MTTVTDLDALAALLFDAYATGMPVPPLTETDEGLTVDDAYAIQQGPDRQPDSRRRSDRRLQGRADIRANAPAVRRR